MQVFTALTSHFKGQSMNFSECNLQCTFIIALTLAKLPLCIVKCKEVVTVLFVRIGVVVRVYRRDGDYGRGTIQHREKPDNMKLSH